MQLREQRDLIGGGILALTGIVFAVYTFLHYDVGTPSRMGPGMFPGALGVILGLLGVGMLFQAFTTRESFKEVRVRVPLFVLCSIAAFAILLGFFGLLPAIVGVVVVSSLAERDVRPVSVAALSGSLCLASWLIFGVGLRMPVAMIRMPF